MTPSPSLCYTTISHSLYCVSMLRITRITFFYQVFLLFFFRLNSLEYRDLKEKLQAPIRNARNIVIKQSLSDQFLEAFREQVNENQVFRLPLNMVKKILMTSQYLYMSVHLKPRPSFELTFVIIFLVFCSGVEVWKRSGVLFSSPDPKGHVRYCHYLASVIICKLLHFNRLL